MPHRRLQQLLNVSWYHHLIAMAPVLARACGLTGNGWDGLVFWDTDTWTFRYMPCWSVLAKAVVAYRMPPSAARENAANAAKWGALGLDEWAGWPRKLLAAYLPK